MGFPNLKGKYAKSSMIEPKEFIRYRKRTRWCPKHKPPEGIIICYNSQLINQIIKRHKIKQFKAFGGDLYFLTETKNKIGMIGRFGIGAPSACVVLEELIAWGVKKFISVGTAGALQKNLKIGTIVVCRKAIRDEGTSHHYFKHRKYAYPSKLITNKIENTLKKFRINYVAGISWTIDAPYRETVSEAKQYQKEGVATVEMEASALFTVAKYRNVQLGAIFSISDSLAELEWKPKFHLKKTKKSLEILYRTAIDVLLNH